MTTMKQRRTKHRQIDKGVRVKYLLRVIEIWKRRYYDLQKSQERKETV